MAPRAADHRKAGPRKRYPLLPSLKPLGHNGFFKIEKVVDFIYHTVIITLLE